MIGRRSLMAMIGLAPVAAVTKTPTPGTTFTPSIARAIPMGYDTLTRQSDGDEVLETKQALDRAKWYFKEGLMDDDHRLYGDCKSIESRKATSPAIKAILQAEYQKRQEVYKAELRWKRAIARKMAPDWIRALFS